MVSKNTSSMFLNEIVDTGPGLTTFSKNFHDEAAGHVLDFRASNSQHVLNREAIAKFLQVRNFVPWDGSKCSVLAITHASVNENGVKEEIMVMDPGVWLAQFSNAENVRADLEKAVSEVVAKWNETNGAADRAGRRDDVKRTYVLSTLTWPVRAGEPPKTTQIRLTLDTFLVTREVQDKREAIVLSPGGVHVNMRYYTDWVSSKGNGTAANAARIAADSGELFPDNICSLNVPWPTFAQALTSDTVAELNSYIAKELVARRDGAKSTDKYSTGDNAGQGMETATAGAGERDTDTHQATIGTDTDDAATRKFSAP